MNKQLLQLTIARIDGALFDGEVVSVTVPGVDGEMTILANHAALISPLKKGVITTRTETEEKTFDIESGTLEVSSNQATVLL